MGMMEPRYYIIERGRMMSRRRPDQRRGRAARARKGSREKLDEDGRELEGLVKAIYRMKLQKGKRLDAVSRPRVKS